MTHSETNKMLFSLACFAFGQLASRSKSLQEHLLIQRQVPFTEKTISFVLQWSCIHECIHRMPTMEPLQNDHFLSDDHLLLLHRTCMDLHPVTEKQVHWPILSLYYHKLWTFTCISATPFLPTFPYVPFLTTQVKVKESTTVKEIIKKQYCWQYIIHGWYILHNTWMIYD